MLQQALDQFTEVGVASAGLRLLDLHRRRDDPAAILTLALRVLAAT